MEVGYHHHLLYIINQKYIHEKGGHSTLPLSSKNFLYLLFTVHIENTNMHA